MADFKELFLYPLTGLYDECHDPNYLRLVQAHAPRAGDQYSLRHLNDFWWRQALSSETLDRISHGIKARYRFSAPRAKAHRLFAADEAAFRRHLATAPSVISTLNAGPKPLFYALETLQMFCELYSDFVSSPFRLSLQDGLIANELCAKTLVHTAADPAGNPYYSFLATHAEPVITGVKPDLAWIVGPIKISTLYMAMMAKRANPLCHVSVLGHATEYYSLNKITKYLKMNDALFSVVDSIVLDDFENTAPQLWSALSEGAPLASVPNLLYRKNLDKPAFLSDGTMTRFEIVQTPPVTATRTLKANSHRHAAAVPASMRANNAVDPSQKVDAKLWPSSQCYWNSCNFCAINKKYTTLPRNDFSDAETVADYFTSLWADGVKYLWSVDEAIPPPDLGRLADALIARGSQLVWETRSKIDAGFTPEICRKLGAAGLREIRLGLESAAPRVLSAMGKFPAGWSHDLIERIVRNFHEAGVSVHFPTIIGFPGETAIERRVTYAFLDYIVAKYPSVTFNINILGLDVASKLFQRYEEFGITEVRWPTNPKYFLGNLLDWNRQDEPFDYAQLDAERNDVMRKVLYPWMPSDASIPAYMYYRLSETSRATLLWKEARKKTGDWYDRASPPEKGETLVLSDEVITLGLANQTKYQSEGTYLVYDWPTHQSFEVDQDGLRTLEACKAGLTWAPPEHGTDGSTERLHGDLAKLFGLGILLRESQLLERRHGLAYISS